MNITPVFAPQIQFKDIYGLDNAYLETNPSLFINEETKNYILLIRLVNYRKFKDRKFAMYEKKSKSIYYIIRGSVTETGSFREKSCKMLNIKTHLPKHNTYWLGGEDIRFIDEWNVLITYPELSKEGKPIICRGRLIENELTVEEICSPHQQEKNWMPFIYEGKNLVVYSVDPFCVKDTSSDFIIHKSDVSIQDFHGSTNGIPITFKNEEGFLFLIHCYNSKNKTVHKLLFYEPKQHKIVISTEFVFFTHSYIEFPCSLVRMGNKIFISLGVNDDKGYIISMDLNTLLNFFSKP